MVMVRALLGAAIMGAMLLASTQVLQAQTTPTPGPGVAPTQESCRQEAIRRGISGDGLAAFMSQCISQPARAEQRVGLDRCRGEAISRGLVGEARNTAIDDCMAQSGEMGSPQTSGTYSFCRAQARSQGIAGSALDTFLNDCVVARR
jgi:hypothetical protein